MARVVVVTGCSTGGIGFALCEEFAQQGCKVYASSRNVKTIADFKDPHVVKLAIDVADDKSVQDGFQHVLDVEGKIDIVVNNAGIMSPGPIVDSDTEDVVKAFNTNTVSVVRVCKTVVPMMAKRRSGLIVNVGSIVAEIVVPWNGIYSASKAAVQSLSDSLTMECKPFNISVLHVSPGSVKSNISNNGASKFSLPENSLYSAYLPNILARIYASQTMETSMPTADFARQVVRKALSKNPPIYMTLGGGATLFKILRWLPKSAVLFLMWRMWSKKM